MRIVGEAITSLGATEIWKNREEVLVKLHLLLIFFFPFPYSLPIALLPRASHPSEITAVFHPPTTT